MVLDSHSRMHRQLRILSNIEKRRKYRNWIQAFQIGMLLFFGDQMVKTYCAGQIDEMEQRPILGQSVLKISRVPDSGSLGLISRLAPRAWEHFPRYLGLGLWLALFALLLTRMNQAKFGELLAFALVLSGGFSNLISRALTTQTFDTFILQLGPTRFVSFNIADVCVIVGSFFVIRGYLLRLRFGWLRTSHSSI